ncbi:hypothetical protein ACFQFH_01435 [Halobaculum halobium]|uniref:Uncharacterized protein n=1 Tax=Halobaculum halobium TaxID=3032281 RepID=A0ABD5T5V6_9EURY|nr:hypothetical protein [Halobaculum sp. SYNS20]
MHDAEDNAPERDAGDAAAADRTGEADQTVEELVEYCRVQAGLLAGRVETMAAEASDRIDEIDEGIAALRADLDATDAHEETGASGAGDDAGAEASGDDPERTAGDVGDEVANLSEAESDLQRKQAMVEATESRMRLFQELATAYIELADGLIDELESGEADPDEAVSRVVSFEAERDAPAYFEERETLVEVAAESTGDSIAEE